MRKCLLTVLLVVVVRPGLGQDRTPGQSPPVPAVPGRCLMSAEADTASAAGPTYGTAAQGDRASASALLSKADHLRIAAEHLEAAGLKEEAQRVRQIAAKEASHPATACPQFVQVDVQMLELSQTRLGKLSSERYGGSKDMSVMELLSKLQSGGAAPGNPTLSPSSNSKLLSLIEALRKDGLVKVLSEPSLMTVPDRSAYMLVGGEFPYPDKDVQGKAVASFKEYGTRLDVLAQIISGDRIHLDFRLRVSERDDVHGVQVGDEKIPALTSREMEAGLDLRPGQTIVLGGLVERRMPAAAPAAAADDKRNASGVFGEAVAEKFQLVVLLKAELVPKGMLENAAVKPAIPR